MGAKQSGALAALVVMVLAGAPPAMAGGHMSGYVLTPEHDDTGRSDEPNFAGTTAALGKPVGERVVDANLDGVGEAYSAENDVAPGCTDDAGRQLSGTCFLHWRSTQLGLPAQPGTPGMGGVAAPGDFTPTKGARVRFMDNIGTLQPVRVYIEMNKKLDDTGLRALLSGVDPSFGNAIVPPSAGFTMWYGVWQDKNGNGVIDHDGSVCTASGCEPGEEARNEFQWEGECRTFTGGTTQVPDWVCHVDLPSTVF
ncbi:MAG: hypothetical protein ACRDH5_07635, partial [bacterium]